MNITTPQTSLIQKSTVPVALIDKQANLIEYSQALAVFFECSEENNETFDNSIIDNVLNTIKPILKSKQHFEEEIKIFTEDNKERWIKLNVYPYFGKAKLYQVFFSDITLQKTESYLAAQAHQLAKVGSWNMNLLTDTLIWSKVAKEIYGYPEDYPITINEAIESCKEGEHRNKMIQMFEACVEKGIDYDLETLIVTATGEEKWIHKIGKAVQVNGKTIAVRGAFQDIDKFKRQRNEFDKLNERMRIAVDRTNIGVWDYDIINDKMIWDRNMFNLFDIKEEGFDFKVAVKNIFPEDLNVLNKKIAESIKNLTSFEAEFRVIDRKNAVMHLKCKGKVLCKESKPYRIVGVNIDVTAEKNKNQKMQELLEVTENQNQRLLNFAYIVSHNLRSSSSNISMLASMLNSKLSKSEQEDFIEMIKVSSDNLNETITQLNEVVKIQTTKVSELQPIFLKEIIDKAIQSISALILDANAEINIAIDDKIKVYGIKPYMNSIFFNLLTNSIKYKCDKRKLMIAINVVSQDDDIIVSFSDNGLGIDLEKHGNKIFGMNKTFHKNKDARGIGLFITKTHVEAMKGEISVTSQVDKGTTFQLNLKQNI